MATFTPVRTSSGPPIQMSTRNNSSCLSRSPKRVKSALSPIELFMSESSLSSPSTSRTRSKTTRRPALEERRAESHDHIPLASSWSRRGGGREPWEPRDAKREMSVPSVSLPPCSIAYHVSFLTVFLRFRYLRILPLRIQADYVTLPHPYHSAYPPHLPTLRLRAGIPSFRFTLPLKNASPRQLLNRKTPSQLFTILGAHSRPKTPDKMKCLHRLSPNLT